MPYFPTVNECYTTQQVTDEFRGYNHNLKIGDGEFYDMKNLTSSYYPLLSSREKRGKVLTLNEPRAMLGKSQLAYIDGTSLYYGGLDLTSYITAKGYSISNDEKMLPKTLISMGAYIVIYPDKLYINTENYSDAGSIEASFTSLENAAVTYTICKQDGTEYETPTIGVSAPENAENGAFWIDTSGGVHALKQYNSSTDMWVSIPTVYTKISFEGIGKSFKEYDGVFIEGCNAEGTVIEAQIKELNANKIIYAKGDDYIVVVGLLDQTYTQTSGSIKVERRMPDLDFITEAENRLWGCKYGLVNGSTVNEIYCCALGDFKNWYQFLGLSTDSFIASVGTDGPFTGAVTHIGYPVFFKENCLHKVYISSSGAHQIKDTACRGVQKGSHLSLEVVNETLYYKGVTDICAYDGSLPISVSPQFGTEKYFDAVGGSFDNKYYVSMKDIKGGYHLFVYDTAKGLWHREDETKALCFARQGDDLFYIDADNKALMAVNGTQGELEKEIEWSATTGLMGYTTVEQKYISRFNLRMKLPVGSKADIYIQYDSDGIWHFSGHIKGTGTKTFMIPVRPRRCDHFVIKIVGKGDIRIYSFAKIHETGSDE